MANNKIKLILLPAAAAGLAVATMVLPVVPWLLVLFDHIGSLGPWAPVALSGFYVLACLFLMPTSIPTIAAGVLFGVYAGSAVAMAGGTAGACLTFGIGRLVARDRVARGIARNRRFTVLDNAVDEHGLKIVMLSRLSPVSPYALVNYAFSLTKISFWKYVLGTVVGVLPGMLLYVYFGAGLRSLAEMAAYARGEGQATPAHRVFFWAGLVVTVVVTLWLGRIAQKALRSVALASEAG